MYKKVFCELFFANWTFFPVLVAVQFSITRFSFLVKLQGQQRELRFYIILSRQILIGQSFLQPFEGIVDQKLLSGEGQEFVCTQSLPASLYGRLIGRTLTPQPNTVFSHPQVSNFYRDGGSAIIEVVVFWNIYHGKSLDYNRTGQIGYFFSDVVFIRAAQIQKKLYSLGLPLQKNTAIKTLGDFCATFYFQNPLTWDRSRANLSRKFFNPASRREFVCVSFSVAQNTSGSGEMQIWEDYEESK